MDILHRTKRDNYSLKKPQPPNPPNICYFPSDAQYMYMYM